MSTLDIAVIGMSCRFPGAARYQEFWRNLTGGVESIRFFSDQELQAAGVDPRLLAKPAYVKARGVLDGIDLWDAGVFGYTPKEAAITDPQQRLFLECAWEALEDSGCDASRSNAPIGVYAAASISAYLMELYASGQVPAADVFQMLVGNDKDFLATRVCYRLGLEGPGVTVQSACSSSLVAVHLACQGLLSGDCDIALAGGVSIALPSCSGYLYEQGGILSPDGHCRAFSSQAAGTVSGSGAGVVALRRLDDALAAGHTIRAVVKASSINNDGSRKTGFTAPRADTQARVIRTALRLAEVDPSSVGYVEAHGTGTALGDPIEISALTQAFREGGATGRGFCAIGSVKTNIGHLDAAAGIAGFIKATLAVQHGAIPASLYFDEPNPAIDFAESPFHVSATSTHWPDAMRPRRAGVSSFGIGGTNAHVVLEQAPDVESRADAGGDARWMPLFISAKTSGAADRAARNLAEHVGANPALRLEDIAYTLIAGRKQFPHRRMVLARNVQEAAACLGDQRLMRVQGRDQKRAVAFTFPGQGAQYPGATAGLYATQDMFRSSVDACAHALAPALECDLRELLYRSDDDGSALRNTRYTQPALFVTEWALAQLWMSWGVHPEALLGHSIGEYVAAAIAGVFSLEDALRLVAIRARLMSEQPTGSMLAVAEPELLVRSRLVEGLWVAAVNSPSACVVAGPSLEIAELHTNLDSAGVHNRVLQTSHAFHSSMMDGALAPFRRAFEGVRLNAPSIPFISCVTGDWISDEQACDPEYWVRQLRATVRCSEGVRVLLAADFALLECGPGRTLTTLAEQQAGPDSVVLASLPTRAKDEGLGILRTAGHAWLNGISVDGVALLGAEQPRRIPLPTYPFERKRYWMGGEPATASAAAAPQAAAAQPANFRQPRPDMAVPYVAASTSAQRTIAAIFEDLLGLQAVGINDSFLELGGDSLMAVRLANRMRDELHAEIPVRSILDSGTVAALAQSVDQGVRTVDDTAALKLLEAVKNMSTEQIKAALQSRVATQPERETSYA